MNRFKIPSLVIPVQVVFLQKSSLAHCGGGHLKNGNISSCLIQVYSHFINSIKFKHFTLLAKTEGKTIVFGKPS